MTKQTAESESRLTSKGRAMRDRIVQSAADLVYSSGARETTLDQVRSAVGASKSQLYHYFSDKDELLHGVIAFQAAKVIHAQQPELGAIDSIKSLKRWRDKLVRQCDTYGRTGGCATGSLANELACHSDNHRRELSAHFDCWAAEIESGLLRMQASGYLEPPLNPKSLSVTFLTAIQGGLLLAKLQRSSTALTTALDEIIRCIEFNFRQSRPSRPRRQKDVGTR